MNAGFLVLPPGVVSALEWLQWVFFAYFIVINVTYLALNYISMFGIMRHMHEHGTKFMWNNFRAYQPPVSVIVPAYNEERTIVSSITLLGQLAPAVIPIVTGFAGSQFSVRCSVFA